MLFCAKAQLNCDFDLLGAFASLRDEQVFGFDPLCAFGRRAAFPAD
jgi:hypothetical protein